MAEFRSDSLDELVANFSEEEFARVKEYVERRDRGTAPTDDAPVETASAPPASIGMFMPLSAPELRGRKNLAMFLERFYTWCGVTGCDSALDSDVRVNKNFWNPARRSREIIQSRVGKQIVARLAISYKGARRGIRDNENDSRDRFPLRGMACIKKNSGRDGR